ncbi:IS256 family transposase [Runella slithyformis]|uniref:Mutator family transposase n=1 Tax=Runella slithyformis (strain ATCC 29530 / DSM 19594 / LMG 11500 / NCIMB 11436 / LSU 4) TaxID=761193 RepID=A0A7U4E852_RUNSL|nr:IS256 family transposase [Runella slithyformis]AEI50616.1 transposase mutator type [Runella slithyformis DSM 19594]AEI51326.1 transposase mutator type [Runella slithyformis DSM 19594]
MEKTEFEQMRDKALEQLMKGQSLTGKNGVFAPLLQQFLESALESEMNAHLNEQERESGNKRNGKGSKRLKTASGEIVLTTPEDRKSTFFPQIVKKRETVLADNLAPQIIGLYSKGMSFRDISDHIQQMYDVEISHATLSEITERVIPQVKEWQSRPLESLYTIVWLDAMHYKVRDGGRVVTRAVYNVLGVNRHGYKDLIGMYVSESEGANFWLSVLTDLKSRGVKDILIACTDNLIGFSEAILASFPHSEIQTCVIHQIRNSLKYVASKDQKTFMQDLKTVYQAPTKDKAELELDKLNDKWGVKYPVVIKSWQNNWHKLSTYFAYDEQIRRLIYTTNAVEGFHRQVRKITKTKGAFPNDMALLKLIYLAVENISRKWTSPLQNWALTAQQLHIKFGDRMRMDL